MRVARVLAITAIAFSVTCGAAVAQGSSNYRVPAEFPPSSFAGNQYVDSRGCVYIRAGIDGATTWVPRMNRSRQVICGFQPTMPTATAQVRQTRPVEAVKAEQPVEITVPQAPKTTQATAQAKPAPVAKPRTVVVRQTVPAAPAASTDAKPRVVKAPVQTVKTPVTTARTVKVAKPEPSQAAAPSACPGASAISSRYLREGRGLEVRCGPQTQPHATIIYRDAARPVVQPRAAASPVKPSAQTKAQGQRRVAPRHVYESQLSSVEGISVPHGYKPVWEDDRLNPKRAHQTFEGKAQMELVWTKTVPRILIDRRTGREVTYRYPGLHYPYTSYEQQRAAGVVVATRGTPMEEPIVVVRGRDGTVKQVVRTQTVKRKVEVASKPQAAAQTVSSKSAPGTVSRAASHRFVQAGMFGNPANAQRAAQMIANSGLPARMTQVSRNGKAYTVVLAGPFQSQSQLQDGLSKVRKAGFGDAFPRN